MIRFTNKTFAFHAPFKDKRSRCKRSTSVSGKRTGWHCFRLDRKKKDGRLSLRQLGVLVKKKRENFDSPFTQIGGSLPGMFNIEELAAVKSLESPS